MRRLRLVLMVLAGGVLACSLPSGASPASRPGSGSFALADPSAGLAQLSGYRAHLTISFSGTKDGAPFEWRTEIRRETVRQPAASFTTVSSTGGARPAVLSFGDEAGTHYFQSGPDGPCLASPGDQAGGAAPAFDPSLLLPAVDGGKSAGPETVGGIPAARYTFDQRALARDAGLQADGQVWVAEPGGWVVKYALEITGGESFFGAGVQGRETWEYELTDAGSLTSIDLPATCPVVSSDLPVLADAASLTRLPNYLAYSTRADFDEAASFYRDRMKSLGWALLADAKTAEGEALLVFGLPDGRRAVATIGDGGGAVRVSVQTTAPTPK